MHYDDVELKITPPPQIMLILHTKFEVLTISFFVLEKSNKIKNNFFSLSYKMSKNI